MTQRLLPLLLLFFSGLSALFAQDDYAIETPKVETVDTFYHAYIVHDDYRWMENVRSPQAVAWASKEAELAQKYLSKASKKTNAFLDIQRYSNVRFNRPVKRGKYYFRNLYMSHTGSTGLFYQTKLIDEEPTLLVDLNYNAGKDKLTLKSYSLSKDNACLAYQFSRNGSDWAEVKVVTMENGMHTTDHLTGLKFSSVAWLNDGFFYCTHHQKTEFSETVGQQVFYHKLGTAQCEDQLIFARRNNPGAQFTFKTTPDERYFILKERNERDGKINIFYIDYHSENPTLKPLITNLKNNISILGHHEENFVAMTSKESNNRMLVAIDPANPYRWRPLLPEFKDAILLNAYPFSERLVAVYQRNQQPLLTVFDYNGKLNYKLEMMTGSSVSGFSGDEEEMIFDFECYTVPPVVYSFSPKTYQKKLVDKTTVPYDVNDMVYTEVEYPGKDSTLIPMVLLHKKGLKRNGNNPTLLKAYGGFGIISSPSFDPGMVCFVKNGGVIAFANIRGGGDKGKAWHNAGRGVNKQTSFDDFIAGAEYLIDQDYTNPQKLASTGGSNGGLVVAAAAIQRPDLFKAVVPVVAPTDMLRFEHFTVGVFHRDEYGTVNDSTSFTRLLAYSPLHNIKPEVNYPAMLLVTSENDDRVPPFHSFKFAAALQNREAQKNPILLDIRHAAGHYGATSLYSRKRERADIFGFIMNELEN